MNLPRYLYELLNKWSANTPVERELLAALVEAESGWNPNIIGDNGHSVGLGQLHDQGAGSGMSVEDRKNPDINLRVTAAYLRSNLDSTPTEGDALSAYNQGLGGWRNNGILASQRHYIAAILALRDRLKTEGIWPDEGEATPPPAGTPPTDVTVSLPAGTKRLIIEILGAVL